MKKVLVRSQEPENEFGRPPSHGIGSRSAECRGCICRWCDPSRYGPNFADGRHWEYYLSTDTGNGSPQPTTTR